VSAPERSGLAGCRRGRVPREERLAAREAARVREHAEAAARLKRKYG
jgi:hypothetical protein